MHAFTGYTFCLDEGTYHAVNLTREECIKQYAEYLHYALTQWGKSKKENQKSIMSCEEVMLYKAVSSGMISETVGRYGAVLEYCDEEPFKDQLIIVCDSFVDIVVDDDKYQDLLKKRKKLSIEAIEPLEWALPTVKYLPKNDWDLSERYGWSLCPRVHASTQNGFTNFEITYEKRNDLMERLEAFYSKSVLLEMAKLSALGVGGIKNSLYDKHIRDIMQSVDAVFSAKVEEVPKDYMDYDFCKDSRYNVNLPPVAALSFLIAKRKVGGKKVNGWVSIQEGTLKRELMPIGNEKPRSKDKSINNGGDKNNNKNGKKKGNNNNSIQPKNENNNNIKNIKNQNNNKNKQKNNNTNQVLLYGHQVDEQDDCEEDSEEYDPNDIDDEIEDYQTKNQKSGNSNNSIKKNKKRGRKRKQPDSDVETDGGNNEGYDSDQPPKKKIKVGSHREVRQNIQRKRQTARQDKVE